MHTQARLSAFAAGGRGVLPRASGGDPTGVRPSLAAVRLTPAVATAVSALEANEVRAHTAGDGTGSPGDAGGSEGVTPVPAHSPAGYRGLTVCLWLSFCPRDSGDS